MNKLFKAPRRRYLKAFTAGLIAYVLLLGPLAPLALAESARRASSRAASGARPAAATSAAPERPQGEQLSAAAAPAALLFAPSITATKTDSFPDPDNDGRADIGEEITYTVTITNNGPDPATGVTFNDNYDNNTTLVAGSVSTQPIAANDTASAFGNVRISTANGAPNLVANDRDPDTGLGPASGLTASGPATSTNGGDVTVAANGDFTYNPPAGYTGSDSFTYTVTDPQGKTDTATMTITVGPTLVWFINNTPGACNANCDGRLTHPFPSIAAYNASAPPKDANDIIFIYTGASNYTGGLTLASGMKVIGQGFALQTETGAPPAGSNALPGAGASPTIDNPGANIITLNSNNTLRGFNTGNSGAAGSDIFGSNFGTLTVSALSINGDGRALSLSTGTLAATVANITVSNTGTNTGITLSTVGGSLTVSGTTTITNPGGVGITIASAPAGSNFSFGNTSVSKASTAGIGVELTNNAGTTAFGTLDITTSNGTGLSGTGPGTVNSTGGTISSAGAAVALSGTGTYNLTFASVTSTAGANGLVINNGTGSFTSGTTSLSNNTGVGLSMSSSGVAASFGGTTVNSAGGIGISLSSNTANISFNDTGVSSSAGDAVDLNTNSGNVSFGQLNLSPDSTFRGLDALNNTGTITTTSGAITTSGNVNANAVFIDGPGGRTPINITLTSVTTTSVGNSVHLVEVTGTKFQVTGTTQVNSRSTVNGGAAVFVDNSTVTTIQFGTTNIPNPNAAGGNGFHVEDTTAAVTVATATISDANQTSGQTDGNSDFVPDNDGDGNAIFLRGNTGSFTLNGGTLSNCGNDCIDTRSSQNLVLSGITIDSPGLDVSGASGSGTGGHGIQAINLTGTNTITNSTITDWETQARDGLRYLNHSAAASTLTLHGVTFSDSAAGSNAIFVSGRDNANMTLNVGGASNSASTNCTFSNIFGAAITHNAGDNTDSTATVNLNVRHSTFSGTPAGGQNTASARNLEGGKATIVFHGNTFNNVAQHLSDQSGVIDIGGDGLDAGNTISVTVTNNTIQNIGTNTGDCDGGGPGTLPCQSRRAIDVQFDDNSNVVGTVLIDGNIITNVVRAGIIFDVTDVHTGTASISAKITNNTVGTDAARVGTGTVLAAGGESGIRIENRDDTGTATNLNILVSGNQIRNGNGGAGLTINTSGLFIRTQNDAVMSATVTSNNINTNTSSGAFEINAVTNFGAGGTLCLDANGNTLAAGAGTIQVSEVIGTLNVEQASAAALAAANGIPAGNVTVGGTPQFGIACATPPAAPGDGEGELTAAPEGGGISGGGEQESATAETTAADTNVTSRPFILARPMGTTAGGTLGAQTGEPEGGTSVGGEQEPEPPSGGGVTPEPLTPLSPTINIGTLNSGDSVVITFKVTVNAQPPVFTSVTNQGTVTGTNFSAVSTDDPSEPGANDPTVTPIAVPPDIYVRDAKIAEPVAGSASMVFTVALSQPALGTLTVNFTTADEPAGPGKAVAGVDYTTNTGNVVFNAGEVLKTISVPVLSDGTPEPDETFLLNLTSAVGNYTSIADAQATGTITVNTPGTVIISELRTSGPGGAGDDFVEIHNNTGSDITVGPTAWALVASNNGCTGDPVIVGLIPNGTPIKARGHFLFTGSQFSLTGHPTGDGMAGSGTTVGTGDATLLADLGQDVNVGLFNVADILNLSSVAKLDGVGFGLNTAGVCDLLREASTLPNAANSTSEYSFVRKMTNPGQLAVPTDANNNATDFAIVSTTLTAVGDNASPQLGAPGPQKSASPRGKTLSQVNATLLDPAVSSANPPNRVRTGSGNSGTVSIRRTFTNNTGGPINALRFTFYDITAGPAPVGTADIRATSSSDTVATVTGLGVVTVRGTVLDTPPAQPLGGGLNSSLRPTATSGLPLANGQSINLQFLFNITQAGTFRVFVTVEALP